MGWARVKDTHMILKRTAKEAWTRKTLNFFWPIMGWKRFGAYWKKRIIRMSDSVHNIALGLSLGIAVSFNPFVGTHIVQAAFFAYLLKANIPASAIGTLTGNPSTFPFMWVASFVIGNTLFAWLGIETGLQTSALSVSEIPALLTAAKETPLTVLMPWAVGGYIAGAVCIPCVYVIAYPIVKGAKAARLAVIHAQKPRQTQTAKDAAS